MRIGSILLRLCVLLAAALGAAAEPTASVRLEGAGMVVEAVPALGGRIAVLRRAAGTNVLAFDPAVLAGPIPAPALDVNWFPSQGHTVWLGPQSSWWAQQDANPARRDARATWPPDPWLEQGAMTVVERGPTRLVLQGPPSPVAGVRLTLGLRIEPDGTVVQDIQALNCGTRTVAWDVWPNTRLRAESQAYAPWQPGTRLRVQYGTDDPAGELALPPLVADGFLSFDIRLPRERAGLLNSAKAFLAAERPTVYALLPGDLVVAAAPGVPPGTLHPEVAAVELFQCVGGDPRRGMLEVEFHSAHRTLAPGESLRYAVAWRVLPYTGGDGRPAQLAAVAGAAPVAAELHRLLGR
jgi:hypothetical protein